MKIKLDFGTEIDILTQKELDDSLSRANDAAARAYLRGVDHKSLPELRGQAASGSLVMGQEGDTIGPRQGYVWSIMRLVVTGLTSGSSPDVVNLYYGSTSNTAKWQFNGNNFGYTFGRGSLVVKPGQTLVLGSVGTFAATGTITLSGEMWEVPSEMAGKLL